MRDQDESKQQLICELEELRLRVATLEASERRYRTIIDTVPLAIGEIDRDGIIVFANAATEKLFGYAPEELVGKRAGDGIEPASAREAFRAWFCHTMLEQPTPSPVFARQVNKDGKQIDIRGDWDYLRNEKGDVVGQVTVIADITDIKQVQEALIEREARLLEAQEVASLGFYVLDMRQGRWRGSSVLDQIFDIAGDYARTVDGWGDLVHLDDRQAMLDYFFKEVVGKRKPFDREYRIVRHGDKQVRWVHGLGRLQFDEEGHPTFMLGTIQDITDRKEAEETLRQSEERLRRFYESGLLGVIYWNMNGQIVDANDKFLEMVGYQRGDLVAGRIDWVNMTPPEYRHLDDRSVEELKTTGVNKVPFEKEYIRKDGTRVPIILAGAMLDEARFNGVAFVIDITERKRAEEALQKAHDQLEQRIKLRTTELAKTNEQLAVFRKFAEASGQAFGMSYLDCKISYVNPAMLRLCGEQKSEDVLGTSFLSYYPGQLREKLETEMLSGLEREGRWAGELTFRTAAGLSKTVIASAFQILDDAGDPIHLAFVMTDITELKQAQKSLERERRTLQHMLQASDHERQLIAYDIHDGLAQELAGAIMRFQVYDQFKDTKRDEAKKAYEGGVTLLRQGHLEARRLISGVRPPILDESGVVAAIAHMVHEPAFDQGPKIVFRSGVTFNRLAPVVENVIYRIAQEGLSNARNHSKSKQIVVSLTQRGARLRIKIQDWGVGFDPKKVQDNHFGLDGIRERSRLLGGKCKIKSKRGEGTSVVVELPAVEQRQEE